MSSSAVRNWRWIPVFATLVAVGGCGDQMGQPVSVLGPDVNSVLTPEATASYGKSKNDGAEKKGKNGPKVKGRKKGGQETEYKAAVRKNRARSGLASETIGPDGGVLAFGEHTLYVPAGAVSERTRFMIREADHQVESYMVLALDLHASRGKGRSEVDVGKDGFNVPVVLCVGVADVADEFATQDQAGIVWYRPSGDVLEAVDAYYNGAGQYCGELDHFSLWGLAWP